MTIEQQFSQCLEQSKRIVSSYRSEAPDGYDPQATWAAVAVVGAGVVAGGVSAATAKSPKTYGPVEMTRQNVSAHGIYGPAAFATNKIYNPAYAQLGNDVTASTLFGTPRQKVNQIIPVYKDGRWAQHRQKFNVPAQEGLLSIYKRAGTDLADYNRQQFTSDLDFYKQSNPLFGGIINQAQQGLQLGGALDPSTRRELEQASLGSSSLRGFGHSPLDAYNIYSSLGQASEERMRQRQQFALQASSMMPDPFSRPALATTLGPALGMQGAAWGRQAANPVMNPFAQSGITSVPQDNTTSNILGAISGGLLSMGGGLAGSGRGNAPTAAANPWAQSYTQPRLG